MIYGYCRISTQKQNIERQIRNILKEYPNARIIQETYTGTKTTRPEFKKLLKVLQHGDILVFDSVSRMSRNSSEGFSLYKELFQKGVTLIFLKERHIDTDIYKREVEKQKQLSVKITTGELALDSFIDTFFAALNELIFSLAEKQFQLAFEQSEKEVKDLQQRTKEGIETARRNGKKIGGTKGTPRKIKNEEPIKELIKKYSRAFNGALSDIEVMALINGTQNLHVSRNTYYKYKKTML